MRNKITLWLFSAFMALILIGSPAKAQTVAAPHFEPVSCDEFDMGEHAPGAVEGEGVECGYLTVPEFHDQPDGNTIELGIVIIKSTSANPAPDPLIMTQGGPGGSGIDLYAFLATPGDEVGEMLRTDRDLIIFEQRGTLYSKPFLSCDEVYDLDIEAMEQSFDGADLDRLYVDAYAACQARLTAEGINLSAYNSEENAHDIAALATALGYDQINYYGVSYGTMLGQHLMRLHPNILRAVILDGVVALDISPNQEMGVANNRSFSALFDACAADAACNQHYPDLERVFFATVDDLNRQPAAVRINDRETNTVYDTHFSGDDLEDFAINLFYITDAVPLMPKFIYDARDGRYDLYSTLQTLLAFDKTDAEGMYFSVMCAEDFDYDPLEVNTAGIRPRFVDELWADAALTQEICATWDVNRLGAAAHQAVLSAIPSLLLSGEFDPVTPPKYADTLATTLDNDYNYNFPANGHGAFLSGDCANEIIVEFINNPAQEPRADVCMHALTAPDFVTPDNTLMSPAITALQGAVNYLFTDPTFSTPEARRTLTDLATAYAPAAMAGLWLFFFPGIWFVGWVLSRLLEKPKERHNAARLAPWVAVLLVGVIGVFAGALGSQLLAGGVFDIHAGISRDYAWVFALPWVIALLTIAMLVLTLLAWIKGYWGAVRRVYYTVTAVAALIYTLTLAYVGMLAVLM